MKEVYIVFGKHVPWTDGAIAFLKINRDSFVTEWDASLQKEIDHLEGHCSQLNSMTPYTPRMSSTVTNSSGLPVHSVNKATTIGMLSLKEIFSLESRMLSQNNKYKTVSTDLWFKVASHPK